MEKNDFRAYVILVTEFNASEYLKDMTPGSLWRQPLGMIFQLLQNCMIHILKDQIQFPAFTKHFNQVDKVLVT